MTARTRRAIVDAMHTAITAGWFAVAIGGLVLIALRVAGCGPAHRSERPRVVPQVSTVVTAGAFRLHLPAELTALERAQAEAAALEHFAVANAMRWSAMGQLGHPTGFPGATLDVFVHPGVTLGSPYMAAVPGLRDADGSVHVALGSCATLPDLSHQAAHAWWAPLEDHSLAPFFWQQLEAEAEVRCRWMRIARGCR